MRKLLCMVILITANPFLVRSQTFVKQFGFDGVGTLCRTVELKDSFVFVTCSVADTSVNFGIKAVLAKFDYAGNLLDTLSFRPSANPQYVMARENCMVTTSDGGGATTGYASDSLGNLHLSFTKFIADGSLQFYKIITPNVPGYKTIDGYKILEYSNKGYYIIGDIQLSNFTVKAFLCLLDFNGNLVFLKYYNSPTFYDDCKGITLLPNQNLLLSIGGEDNNPNDWEHFCCTRFLEVDTQGIIKKTNATVDSNMFVHYNINSSVTDNNYFTCGKIVAARIVNQNFQNQCALVKWDTSYNPLWSYTNGIIPHMFNSFTDFEQAPNTDIILCGQEVCGIPCGSGVVGKLTKIDKDGNLIWNRNYKGYNSPTDPSNDYNYLYDVDLMPTGDIIAVGTCEGNATLQYSWLLRVNSDGCMDDGTCGYTDIEEHGQPQNAEPIRVYPNPSNGIFTVYANADLPPAACITVFDINGKQLLRQPFFNQANLLNLHHLPNGIYIYEIGNGLVKVYSGKLAIEK